jgi:hypothetical protein
MQGLKRWPEAAEALRCYLASEPDTRPSWQVEALADAFSGLQAFASLPWQARLRLFKDLKLKELPSGGNGVHLASTLYSIVTLADGSHPSTPPANPTNELQDNATDLGTGSEEQHGTSAGPSIGYPELAPGDPRQSSMTGVVARRESGALHSVGSGMTETALQHDSVDAESRSPDVVGPQGRERQVSTPSDVVDTQDAIGEHKQEEDEEGEQEPNPETAALGFPAQYDTRRRLAPELLRSSPAKAIQTLPGVYLMCANGLLVTIDMQGAVSCTRRDLTEISDAMQHRRVARV